MKMNLKPSFRYQFSSFLKGSAVVYVILTIIAAGLMIGTMYVSTDSSTTFSFTGYSITAAIFMFVMGIVNIRSDLRLCLQFGISRRTSFVSELLAILATSFIVAVAGELLTGIVQALSVDNSKLYVADLFQLIYAGDGATALTLGQHAMSALLNTSLTFCACIGGMFFSLMFWRLNKLWTIVVAISIPLLINIVPILLYKAGVNLEPLVTWIRSSPINFVLFFLLSAALFVIINWLLLRKANIKEAKS